MQVTDKIFEVDQVVCRRLNKKGKEEYLVQWKSFDAHTATWEPSDNLLMCTDLIQQFQRKVSPIPGANPFCLESVEKTKRVHVKMLMNRKRGIKRRKSCPMYNENIEENADKIKLENVTAASNNMKEKIKRSNRESERLIRDTLLHEAKSFKPLNGLKNHVDELLGNYDKNIVCNSNLISSFIKKNNYSRNYRDSSIKDHVLCNIKKGYMEIILNNSARHNVMSIGMMENICDCLQRAKKNQDIKLVLFTNNGDYFCSGIDYTELKHNADDKDYKTMVNDLVTALKNFVNMYMFFPKPIMCAINGTVLEFGFSLLLGADYAYSTSKSHFDVMFTKLELTPIGGFTKLLPLLVGPTVAKSMCHGGRLSAVGAYERGFILEMFGVNSFEEDIAKKLKEILSASSRVLESTKHVFDISRNENLAKTIDEEFLVYHQCLLSKDFKKKLKEEWTSLISLYGGI